MASETSKFLDLVNEGRVSSLPEEQGDTILVDTLPGEDVTWIGQVDTDSIMFGTVSGKYGSYDVLMGISPYRVVFYLESGVLKTSYHSRSYWFEVDLQGEIWERGALRKREYTSLSLADPKFKKGLASSSIILSNNAKRKNSKVDRTFETTVSSLKWLNQETKKFEGRKAQILFDQLMEVYENRKPVTIKELMILVVDPEALAESFYATEAAEGQAIRVVTPPLPEGEEIISRSQQKVDDDVHPCPKCGYENPVGIEICPHCAHNLMEEKDPLSPGVMLEEELTQEEKVDEKKQVEDLGSDIEKKELVDDYRDRCPECGHKIKATTIFCGGCGVRLQDQYDVDTSESVGSKEGVKVEEKDRHSVEEVVAEKDSHAETIGKEGDKTKDQDLNCVDCGEEIQRTWKRCPHCGSHLPLRCLSCGEPVDEVWIACAFCGASLST